MAMIYGSHPYGRSVTVESLQAITRDQLQAFHRTHYTAGSAAVTIVSNDPDEPQVAVALQGVGVVLSLQPATLGLQDGGNGVWEPGETAALTTAWTNTGTVTAVSVTGVFTAPPGITMVDAGARYGDIPAGATRSCASGDCADAAAGGPRPATPWDAALSETLSTGHANGWTLHVGASFLDHQGKHQHDHAARLKCL